MKNPLSLDLLHASLGFSLSVEEFCLSIAKSCQNLLSIDYPRLSLYAVDLVKKFCECRNSRTMHCAGSSNSLTAYTQRLCSARNTSGQEPTWEIFLDKILTMVRIWFNPERFNPSHSTPRFRPYRWFGPSYSTPEILTLLSLAPHSVQPYSTHP